MSTTASFSELMLLVAFAGIFSHVWANQVCCPDVGCFATTGDFRHLPAPKCVETFGVKLALYTRSNSNSPQYLERKSSIPSRFASYRRSIFVIHGYQNSGTTSYMIEIKDSILRVEDANVFLVDWQNGANSVYYPNSASNTRVTGAEVALLMDRLVNEGRQSRSRLWCVGFSLGAHTCGFAGMRTQIERITGLDPAGPSFDGYPASARLNPNTAKLVDVVHTDGTGYSPNYGLITPLGHIDFYPNGGTNQPNCWTYEVNGTVIERDVSNMNNDTLGDWSLSCSHGRAVQFFASSTVRGCFNTRLICTDERRLPNSCTKCNEGTCQEMGFYADRYQRRGKFYLETTGKAPYCLY